MAGVVCRKNFGIHKYNLNDFRYPVWDFHHDRVDRHNDRCGNLLDIQWKAWKLVGKFVMPPFLLFFPLLFLFLSFLPPLFFFKFAQERYILIAKERWNPFWFPEYSNEIKLSDCDTIAFRDKGTNKTRINGKDFNTFLFFKY